MRTRILNIVEHNPIEEQLKDAFHILHNSGVIAFPTETVYGLGCDIQDEIAMREIYRIKGRSFDKPLAAHIASLEQVEFLCVDIPAEFYLLAERFLPGPLSIILKKNSTVSDLMTAHMGTIGIRFPNNKTCLKLISAFGRPLAATSANISGSISPINAEQVLAELNNKIPLIISDGDTKEMKESTIISLVGQPKIIREGAIPIDAIQSLINRNLG